MTLSVEQMAQALENLDAKINEATAAFNDELEKLNEKKAKIKAWLWDNAEHTADSITEEYVMMRDERARIKKEYEERDAPLVADMDIREAWLLTKLKEIGAESLRTAHGTAYIQVKTRASCSDWPLFWKYIAENNRFDMLEKRVSQKPISDMLDNNEELPPAINTFSERVVTIRRA